MTYHRRIIVRHLAETERELVEADEHLADERAAGDFGERLERHSASNAAYRELERLLGPTPRRSDGYDPVSPTWASAELDRLLGGGDS